MPTLDPDAIGISYQIDLAKLDASIRAASTKLGEFNKKIESLGKQASAKMNVAANSVKNIATASGTASEQLKKMGISANTTAAEIKAMNLSAVEVSAALKLTKDRMKELTNQTAKTGKTTKASRQEFRRLEERMPGLTHEANKGVKAFGDYRRAMDRWGAGFKFMILSQAAWIASGAILFGTLTAITNAIKNFVDFHQDLRNAAAIVQATTAGYEKMEKAAVKAFLNSTLSLKDTTNALTILGQTGLEAAESAIVLETAYKITTATGGDMTTVVKFLTTAMSVWQIEAEGAAKIGNVLGAALNFSKLEVADLGTTFNFVASMAKSVGLSITDLSATMAVMSNAGIKASTIGTGLRGVFSKLLATTPKFEKELAKVGLSLDDVSLKTNSFFEVLKNLESAGFDIENIFKGLTRREAASLNVLLEQGSDRLDLMREALTDTNAVSVLFGRSMEGMKNQLILTGHAIQQFMIDRLNFLRPIITGTAKFIRELFTVLGELNGLILVVSGAWVTYRLALLSVSIATSGVAAATGKLAVVFAFLGKHPLFLAMTALVVTYATLKRVIDATTESLDEQLNKTERTIDDLRKLQILMKMTNKTEQEKLEILSNYAKDYPQLLDFLETHRDNIIGVNDALKELVDTEKLEAKAIKAQMVAQKQADLSRIQALLEIAEKRKKEFEQDGGLIKSGLTNFLIDPAIKKYKSQIQELTNDIKRMKIELGVVSGGKIETGEEGGLTFKWLPEMERALEKLRLKVGTETERARKELIKGLASFGLTEEAKTDETEKQTQARILLYQKYDETITKIDEKQERAIDRAIKGIERKVKSQEAALERFAAKQVSESLRTATRLLREFARAEKQEKSFRSKISKFREGLSDDEAKLVKNDFERKQLFLDKEIQERRRKYNELLEDTKDYYATLSKLAEDNDLLVPEKEKIEKMISAIEAMVTGLEKIETGEREDLFGRHPSNFSSGIEEGLRQARATLSDEYTIWKNLTNNVALAMRDSFSDLFFDAMRGELTSLADYFDAFATAVKRQIADVAASWVTSGLFGKDTGGGLFGSILGAVGNIFNPSPSTGGAELGAPTFHSGGLNRRPGDTLNLLRKNEFVIKDSSARSIGTDALNFANRTGRLPSSGGNVTHVSNSYTIVAIDSESMDQALRRGGARAIQDISVGSFLNERERNPRFGVR